MIAEEQLNTTIEAIKSLYRMNWKIHYSDLTADDFYTIHGFPLNPEEGDK